MRRAQHTMQLLRRLDGGMAGFRRSKEWSFYRSLDTWSQVVATAPLLSPDLVVSRPPRI